MRGGGIRRAITTDKMAPPARLLDITRLISRAGRIATGIDRVELAYLIHLAVRPEPLFTIARTPFGFILIGPENLPRLTARLTGTRQWGAADQLSRLAPRRDAVLRRAESDLRRLCLDRCRPRNLSTMLRRHLPAGMSYFNTGHANLTDHMLSAVRESRGQIAVLVHDVIPLDYPHYQRPDTPARFAVLLQRVRREADLVIYNSHHTRERAELHMAQWGPPPVAAVAHLGVERHEPDPAALSAGLPPGNPYFVTLGTIEPRKGHDILLDVWDDLARQMETPPTLLICGARGWSNRAVFDRLDRLPPGGPVRELNGLTDGAIAALVAGARAMLCPSRTEGFGLPAVEAAARGIPVICNDLPVYREVIGDIPIYLKETGHYSWGNMIRALTCATMGTKPDGSRGVFVAPTWKDHFRSVLGPV